MRVLPGLVQAREFLVLMSRGKKLKTIVRLRHTAGPVIQPQY